MPAPLTASKLLSIALAHHQAGRLNEAEGIYRQILSSEPAHAVALDYLGVLAVQTQRFDQAIDFFNQSIASDPSRVNAFNNLGECLRKVGRYQDALDAFDRAIAVKPDLALAHNNRGITLVDAREFAPAVASLQRAIELKPDYGQAYSNLANALVGLRRLDEAVAAARTAVSLQPTSAEAHNSLAVALAEQWDYAEAIAEYHKAIELKPTYAEAWSNLGNALAAECRDGDAVAACSRAVELSPQDVQSHWNLAVALLRHGDWERGWREYEHRFTWQTHFPKPSPRFYLPRISSPHWLGGEPLEGKRVFLHAEQGFGDAIHFARYASLVAERGAEVTLEVHEELYRIMQTLPGVKQVIRRGDVLPPFDLHCPLMSLPLAFGTTPTSIPGRVPYLFADQSSIDHWRQPLGPAGGRLRVGLCWAGNPDHSDNDARSTQLRQYAPLAKAGVEFHSLQHGPPAIEAYNSPAGMAVIDHSDALHNFADTAGLLMNLDLIICVDTAVAHLAGALGRPVWVLNRMVGDWRWLTGRDDTPWYPTMRLFRQKKRGDWKEVIERVRIALTAYS